MDPQRALILEPVPQYEIQCLTMDEVNSTHSQESSIASKRDILGEILSVLPGGSRIQSLRSWIQKKSEKDLVQTMHKYSNTFLPKDFTSDCIIPPFYSYIAFAQSRYRAAKEKLYATATFAFFSDIKGMSSAIQVFL